MRGGKAPSSDFEIAFFKLSSKALITGPLNTAVLVEPYTAPNIVHWTEPVGRSKLALLHINIKQIILIYWHFGRRGLVLCFRCGLSALKL